MTDEYACGDVNTADIVVATCVMIAERQAMKSNALPTGVGMIASLIEPIKSMKQCAVSCYRYCKRRVVVEATSDEDTAHGVKRMVRPLIGPVQNVGPIDFPNEVSSMASTKKYRILVFVPFGTKDMKS